MVSSRDLLVDSDEAVARVAADLEQRMELFRECNIVAGQNLKIAQHRDTLRYASLRSGSHRRPTYHFHKGQYVQVKRKGAHGLESKSRGVYEVEAVKPDGTLLLKGACGTKFTEHMNYAVPYHGRAENIVKPAKLDQEVPSADLVCEVCQADVDSDLMLICDHCELGWHTYCLSPPLESGR